MKTTVEYASAHDFRRTFARRWVKAPVLKVMMRHADIKTTLQHYAKIESDEAAELIWKHAAETGLAHTFAHNPVDNKQKLTKLSGLEGKRMASGFIGNGSIRLL